MASFLWVCDLSLVEGRPAGVVVGRAVEGRPGGGVVEGRPGGVSPWGHGGSLREGSGELRGGSKGGGCLNTADSE